MNDASSRVGRLDPHPLERLGGDPVADRHVPALARLADVVQERAEQRPVAIVRPA